MSVTEEIRQRLEASFRPSELDVVDDSEAHRGHAGYQEGGESHFQVRMTAEALGPMSRIERHRAVHDAIGKDIMGRIHALALDLN
ncbi:BolA family protein [Pseudaestuariivita rosea]|uniref:BolA family protein n=1 Tax=Pseudaestuariivita rosea TaxID=2763263 RepID=UPI001ABBC8C7|nr:BolA family protein [Pseudaestuariivita rosea]